MPIMISSTPRRSSFLSEEMHRMRLRTVERGALEDLLREVLEAVLRLEVVRVLLCGI